MKNKLNQLISWVRQDKQHLALGVVGGVLLVTLLVQVFYSGSRLLPFTEIDGLNVSGWKKDDAAWQLNHDYKQQRLGVYFGSADKPKFEPAFADFGVSIDNESRLDQLNYPWWLRLVPTSILWGQAVVGEGEVVLSRDTDTLNKYIDETVGDSCLIEPTNASLKPNGSQLELVPAAAGGRCDIDDITASLRAAQPSLTEANKVRIDMETIAPAIDDDQARELAEKIESKVGSAVSLKAGGETVNIPAETLISWLDFNENDGQLSFSFNAEQARDYLGQQVAPRVAVAPGVTRITTRDFVVVSRQEGKPGRGLNQVATLDQIRQFIAGELSQPIAQTTDVPPEITYSRSYSPTDRGLSALLQHFANDNKGEFGISLIELSGQRRRAEAGGSRQFTTASTYKLFVAYSTLRRVESGQFSWNEPVVGGRNLSQCFDDMIVNSDNPCAETLLKRIGFKEITSEMNKLGLKNTTFLKGDTPLTTSDDLALFLATLESGQMLKQSSRDRLIGAMRRNVYRQGVPAGTSGQVADKVGFLDSLLHDAAIVYSPNGTYVLTVLTKGSSWAKIAELTREIEKIRAG